MAVHSGMDVSIREPEVSPLQPQGPQSLAIMQALFGEDIADLRYFRLRETELDGIPLVVSRTSICRERATCVPSHKPMYIRQPLSGLTEAAIPNRGQNAVLPQSI